MEMLPLFNLGVYMFLQVTEAVETGFFSQLGAFANYVIIAALFSIAGTVITQFIKKLVSLKANKAFFLAIGVSALLGCLTGLALGKFDVSTVFEATTLIFAFSTMVYQFLFSKDRVLRLPF